MIFIFALMTVNIRIYESKSAHFFTTEELPPNSLIGDLRPFISSDMLQTLRLSNMDFKTSDYFLLHSSYLKIKRSIDREEICPKSTKNNDCILRLILIYGQTKKPSFITVLITVNDINDNTPKFTLPEIEHLIVENANAGLSDLYLYEAEDPDRQENGTITYKLQENKDFMFPQFFRLQVSPDNVPRLMQLFPLDYEARKVYIMELIAVDDGNPQKTGILKIKIRVQDENDNLPLFEKALYEETIMENISVKERVIEIVATDSDSDENGKINYHFAAPSNNQQQIACNYFGIITESGKGKIYVKQKLDIDLTPRINRFDLMVLACDNGHPQRCSRTTVTIRVIDVNDFRPLISINYITNNGHGEESSTIQENSVNNYIATVTVVDKDSGPGGIVECDLTNPNFALTQGINDKEFLNLYKVNDKSQDQQIYHIKNTKEFDREENDHVKFKIICKDNPNLQRSNQNPIQLTSEAEIVVLIDDENDNPPEYSKSPYEFKTYENRPRHEEKRVKLGILEVSDKDIGSIFYHRILINPSQAFELTESGELFLILSFDREEMESNPVRLLASVSDGKFNQTVSVNVQILDENDLAPVFSLNNYRFNCAENSFSSFVGQVEATDSDSDIYGPIEYKIALPSPLFSINSKSGMIRVTTKLDREEKEFYAIQILAIDNSNEREGNRRTGTTTVSVTVLDLNDNYPKIKFPPPQKLIVIDSNWQIGHNVFTMEAYDPDLNENGSVSYKIIKDGFNLFKIHPTSGNLIINMKPSLSEHQLSSSHLVLVASDNGIPSPKSSAVSVQVRLPVENPAELSENNSDSLDQPRIEKSNKKTMIVIIVVALALIVTIIMTIIIIIYHTKMPPTRPAVKHVDEFQNIHTKCRNFTPVNGHNQSQPLDENVIGTAKIFHQSSSLFRNEPMKDNHFEKLHDPINIDEYQQLMTTPTLLRIWHNNLNQYNEFLPSDNASHFPSPSSAPSPIPVQVFGESLRDIQKTISTDQSLSSNYLQSSFV